MSDVEITFAYGPEGSPEREQRREERDAFGGSSRSHELEGLRRGPHMLAGSGIAKPGPIGFDGDDEARGAGDQLLIFDAGKAEIDGAGVPSPFDGLTESRRTNNGHLSSALLEGTNDRLGQRPITSNHEGARPSSV